MTQLDLLEATQLSANRCLTREEILGVQDKIPEMIEAGQMLPVEHLMKWTHHFTDPDTKYGCGMYAREMFLPKGGFIVGKLHKQPHLSVVLKGKIIVFSEKGKHYFEAPCVLPSHPGDKRIGYAVEDTIWLTVHLTKHLSEEKMDDIEEEVIAKSYEELERFMALENKEVQS